MRLPGGHAPPTHTCAFQARPHLPGTPTPPQWIHISQVDVPLGGHAYDPLVPTVGRDGGSMWSDACAAGGMAGSRAGRPIREFWDDPGPTMRWSAWSVGTRRSSLMRRFYVGGSAGCDAGWTRPSVVVGAAEQVHADVVEVHE